MSVVLSAHSYGKSNVRLTKVIRHDDRHDLIEWTVDVRLGGDFAESYTLGDNRKVVATDTMKNRVYVLARDATISSPEEYALRYTGDFLSDYPQVESATVKVTEHAWQRIKVDGKRHPTSFMACHSGSRFCEVTQTRDSQRVSAGLQDIPVLKTTNSAFRDFHRDQYTTLPDTDDRILATLLTAEWQYGDGQHDWNIEFDQIKSDLLESFARHNSLGVQQTLFVMGAAVLKSCATVTQIDLTMPNRHRLLFNMQPFNRTNPNEVFVTTDEPYGVISATLRRDEDASSKRR